MLGHKIYRAIPLLVGTIALFFLQSCNVKADTSQRYSMLTKHIPAAVATATLVDQFQESRPISLVITLPPRNQDSMKELLKRLYDPANPLYGQFITHDEYLSRFGPAPADVEAVKAFATHNGFTITHVSASNTSIDVIGTEANVESAFGIAIDDYIAADGRAFFAPSAEPTVTSDVANKVFGIIGLDNYARLSHYSQSVDSGPPSPLPGSIQSLLATPLNEAATSAAAALPTYAQPLPSMSTSAESQNSNSGNHAIDYGTNNFTLYSASSNGLEPDEIDSIYSIPSADTTWDGASQTIALAELGSFLNSDIQAYMTTFWNGWFAYVQPQIVQIDGGVPPGPPSTETTLDIDMVEAVAPASNLIVYEPPHGDATEIWQSCAYDMYDRIASDDTASVVSSSWGAAANEVTPTLLGQESIIFGQMAAQGQSFFCAAGDTGAYANEGVSYVDGVAVPYAGKICVQDPASQQFATAVGATSLNTNANSTTYSNEVAWSDGLNTSRGSNGLGGGGGYDALDNTFTPAHPGTNIPSYQVDAFSTSINPQGSTVYRNVPDVSLFGDYVEGGYYTIYNGYALNQGGSSAAAPLWAALTAIANELRQTAGLPNIGFVNPTIYSMAENPYSYAQDFHDVTTGNNLYYNAVPGYDNATGWGSFNGYNMILDLALWATWKPVSLSVDSAGNDHILWSGAGGGWVSIWTISSSGTILSNIDTWGVYSGWTPKQILTNSNIANSPTYVLWASSPGTAAIWQSSGNSFQILDVSSNNGNFGPGGFRTAQGISENADGSLNVLWDNTANGQISIWKGVISGSNIAFTENSALTPPTGYTAQGITTGPNSQTYVMWTNSSGAMTTWATNGVTYNQLTTWGPISGWTATSIASAPDSTLRIMWTNVNSDMILWATNGTSSPNYSNQFGPFTTYTPTSLAVDSSDNMRVLWQGPGYFETVWTTNGTSVTQTPNAGPP